MLAKHSARVSVLARKAEYRHSGRHVKVTTVNKVTVQRICIFAEVEHGLFCNPVAINGLVHLI